MLVWGTAGIVAVLILAAIFGTGSGNKSKSSTAATHAAKASSVPAVSNQAARWYKAMQHDANTVQVDVQAAILSEGIVAKENPQVQADINQAAQMAQTAHDDLTNIKDDFAGAADGTGSIMNYETEAYGAVNDLKNSMGSLVTYLGTPNAATLARFNAQFSTAISEWDDAVKALWSGAGMRNPPTI